MIQREKFAGAKMNLIEPAEYPQNLSRTAAARQ